MLRRSARLGAIRRLVTEHKPLGTFRLSDAGRHSRNLVQRFLRALPGASPDVEMFLRQFSSVEGSQFAVIKVGGAVVDEELNELCESLTFLHQVGLSPVVVHGGGPQLNKRLQDIGEVPRYVDGLRVTTPDTLEVALQVFHEENARLVETLEQMGTRARPVLTGVFEAQYLNEAKYGYVGDVTGVRTNNIESSIRAGQLPILVSVGYTRTGQALNINADVAAGALARTIQPLKTVYLNSTGGLPDSEGRVISSISMEDYDELMAQPWMREGTKLKVQEIKHLLDDLPPSSSVAVTRAADLPRELFTVGGAGTILRKGEKLECYNAAEVKEEVSLDRLEHLLESSFGKALVPGYLESALGEDELDSLYVSASMRATAIITRPRGRDEDGDEVELNVPYMDKFAVAPNARGEGLADMLFSRIQSDHPTLFWRAKANNPINRWYFQKSDGAYRSGDWTVFWYGVDNFAQTRVLIETALALPETFRRSHGMPEIEGENGDGENSGSDSKNNGTQSTSADTTRDNRRSMGRRSFSTSTASSSYASTPLGMGSRRMFSTRAASSHSASAKSTTTTTATATATATRAFSSTGEAPGGVRRKKMGIIGARGYTGAELMRIVARHPEMEIVAVSSRQLEGTPVKNACPELDCGDLLYSNLSPEECAAFSQKHNVDVWVMALPNGVCPPYVDALLSNVGHQPVVIDLGADYRFNDAWTYGFPERYRDDIRKSKRIANPGCYATGMQTAILPFALSGQLDTSYPPTVFGVSGYSGAGTTPSDKNDPVKLHDNLMAYALSGHMHEREVTRQCGTQIHFTPHVAPFFQGIHLTTTMRLIPGHGDLSVLQAGDTAGGGHSAAEARNRAIAAAKAAFDGEPLVRIDTKGIPEVRDAMHRPHVTIGGFHVDAATGRLVMVSTIDNLLKGAATQCMQNVNLALGLDELLGIDTGASADLAPCSSENKGPAAVAPVTTKPNGGGGEVKPVTFGANTHESEYHEEGSEAIIERSSKYIANTYGRNPVALTSGSGAMLTDADGKSYIDMFAGIAVNALGTGHPHFVGKVTEQLSKLVHVSNLFHNDQAARLAKRLVEASFADRVFFANTGCEANEAALKFALRRGEPKGKHRVVSFKGGFHGRTLGALSMTYKPSIRVPYEPYLGMGADDTRFGTYNDVASVDSLVGDDVAAVFVEPVQGEGGVHEATPEFLSALRAACDRVGAVLVFDEVQIGIGRSGRLFAYERLTGVVPDMVTMAKPLAGGLPIGAVLATNAALENVNRGDHGTTFGGGPLVAAAANAVLDIVADRSFLGDVERKGAAIRDAIREARAPIVKDVRGVGMLIGVELDGVPASKVVDACRDNGVLVITAGDAGNVVRIAPPLNIGWDKLDAAIKVINQVLETLSKEKARA